MGLVLAGSTIPCDEPAHDPFIVYGYCFEQNNGLCDTDTEVVIYVNDTSDNVSMMVNLTYGMYWLDIGELEYGWSFGENMTLIVARGNIESFTVTKIQPAYPGGMNQLVNLTLKCPQDHELFNNCCYHKCDLNRDGILNKDYNDLTLTYKSFLGINKNYDNHYQNWSLMKHGYQRFINDDVN